MPPQADTLPFVTVAIPCFNERRHIEACISDVLQQDYPADRFEVLVGDGMSSDGTRDILARLAADSARLRVVDNPDRLQAAGLNAMIREARGDVIIRMDVHARYARDFLRQCVLVLRETGAQNVGGAARASADSFFQRAACAALDSPLSYGGSSYRNVNAEGWVDTVFPGAFPRQTFETVGGFDPRAITNEDAELNQRILAAGGRIYLSRKIVCHYYPRDSFRGLARQYFKYGMGRARTLLKHGRFPTPRPAIPFLTVVGGVLLLATSGVQPFTLPAFGLYALATGAEAVRVCRRHSLALTPYVWAIFPVLHVSHGVGFGYGLWHYLRHPDWANSPAAVPARRFPGPAPEPAASSGHDA
jgi:succinoglycan biosynthesis protein ExoA